jgi:hypothetical protein
MQLVSSESLLFGTLTNGKKVLARYLFRINGHLPTDWELKGVAIAGYSVAVIRKCSLA